MLSDFAKPLKGEYHGRCSAYYFLMHMAVAGTWRDMFQTINRGQWSVFCLESSSAIGIQQESIEDKVKCFLQSEKCGEGFVNDALVQLWVPATTAAGRNLLTSSEQPFGMTATGGTELESDLFYNGLCNYRCYSVHLGDSAEDIAQFGPVGRVFTRGYPEFCANIKGYSVDEFPMRDYAIECGIARYWALPLFQLGAAHHCVGVLEGLSIGIFLPLFNPFGMIRNALEDLGLECPDYDHRGKCLDSRVKLVESQNRIIDIVKSLKDEYGSPLSQVWVPCMCGAAHQAFVEGTKVTELFSHVTFLDMELSYSTELHLMTKEFSVKSGKGLVGRAYLENKVTFCRDTTRFSISDYHLLPLTRSSGLTSCFAIPLQLLHPHITSFILEVFLPPQWNCEHDLVLVLRTLRSLLSIMSAKLSSLNVNNGTQRDFSVKVSHLESDEDDNFVYFDVDRIDGAMSSADNWFQPLRLRHNAQCHDDDDDANIDAEVPVGDDDQVQIPEENEETVPSDEEEGQFPSLSQTPAHEKPKAKSSRNACTGGRKSITYDDLVEHFDKSINEAAEELGGDLMSSNLCPGMDQHFTILLHHFAVSRSTLKRMCRKLGVDRWPSRKRNKIHGVHSSSRPIEVGSENFQTSEIVVPEKEAAVAIKNGRSFGVEINQSYTMEVKATYMDDDVLFNLSSDSKMEELRRNLEERFELDAVQRYKIKYEYEGGWIMIACDQDLRLRMDTLRSTEQTRMNLSVFPIATL